MIVESYKNTPPLNEDSVLFTKNRTSIGKVSNHYTSLDNFISQTFVTIHKMICCLIRWWYIVHCNFLSYCVIINSFVGLKYCWFLLRSLKCSVQFVSPTMFWGSTLMTTSTRKILKLEIQFTSPPKLKISQTTSLHSYSKSEYIIIWENSRVPQFNWNTISLLLFCCGVFPQNIYKWFLSNKDQGLRCIVEKWPRTTPRGEC